MTSDWFFVLDAMYTKDNGAGSFHIGFVAYSTDDTTKFPYKRYGAGEIFHFKLKNIEQVEYFNSTTIQQKWDQPLLYDFERLESGCD